jgi:hypothetical protein
MSKTDHIVMEAIFCESKKILEIALNLKLESGEVAEDSTKHEVWRLLDEIIDIHDEEGEELKNAMKLLKKAYGSVIEAAEKDLSVREGIVRWLCSEEAWGVAGGSSARSRLSKEWWKDGRVVKWCAAHFEKEGNHPMARWVESDDVDWVKNHLPKSGINVNGCIYIQHSLSSRGYVWQVARSSAMFQALMDCGVDIDQPPWVAVENFEERGNTRVSKPIMSGAVEWALWCQEKSGWSVSQIIDIRNMFENIGRWSESAEKKAAVISTTIYGMKVKDWSEEYGETFSIFSDEHPMLEFWKRLQKNGRGLQVVDIAMEEFSKTWHRTQKKGREFWVDMLAEMEASTVELMLQKDPEIKEKLNQERGNYLEQWVSSPNLSFRSCDPSLEECLDFAKRSTEVWHNENHSVLSAIKKKSDNEKSIEVHCGLLTNVWMAAFQANPEGVRRLPSELQIFVLKSLSHMGSYEPIGKRMSGKWKWQRAASVCAPIQDNRAKLFFALVEALGKENPLRLEEMFEIMHCSKQEEKNAVESAVLRACTEVDEVKTKRNAL